jgi:hypothetical protein
LKQNDIEETSISKVRTSISTWPNILISKNAPSISARDIEFLIFDIDGRILRYLCFFVGSFLGCCSSYSVLDTDCGVHILLQINHRPWLMLRRPGRPQPPQQGLNSAAQPHRSQSRTGRSTGRSRRSGARTRRVRLLVQVERRPGPDQQRTSAGPSGAALGPAEYVKLNLVPESL